jgi:hypothetical protein
LSNPAKASTGPGPAGVASDRDWPGIISKVGSAYSAYSILTYIFCIYFTYFAYLGINFKLLLI